MRLYKTGEEAPKTGTYNWVKYTDDTVSPTPTPNELQIRLEQGEKFPPIRSAGKAAWWRLAYL